MRSRLAAVAGFRPPRRTGTLMAATLVLAIGKGAFLTTLMVYLLKVAALGTLAATATLSLWGAASVVVSVPIGVLVDRVSARAVGAVSAVCTALLMPVIAQVHDTALLMLVVFVAGATDSAANVTRRALLAGGTADGVTALAWARTVLNVGWALGALVSVQLLSANSRSLYALAYALVGVSYLVLAVCMATTSLTITVARDPGTPRAPATRGTWRRNIRTGSALAAATGILLVHATLLHTVLPLWITGYTSVPVATLGWLVMLNSVVVIAGQIPVSRMASTTASALRCLNNSAVCIAVCCALLCSVPFGSPFWQVCGLVAATVALTLGELLQAAGEWGLSATLAAAGEHGFYQAACVFGESAQSSVGPVLVGTLVTAMPVLGWVLLIGLVGLGRYVTGLIAPPARAPDTGPVPAGQPRKARE